jgi:hypothetical protein
VCGFVKGRLHFIFCSSGALDPRDGGTNFSKMSGKIYQLIGCNISEELTV